MTRLAIIAVVAAGSVACGSQSPTDPAPDTVQALYIEGDAVLAVGQAAPVAAFWMETRQPTRNVSGSARWSSAIASVVSLSDGKIRGVSSGESSITAEYRGASTRATVVVVQPATGSMPDFSGAWNGTLLISSCVRSTGAASNPCRFVQGSTVPFQLTITSSGSMVAGTLQLYTGRAAGAVRGVIVEGGELLLTGTLRLDGPDYAAHVRQWRLRRDGDGIVGSGTLENTQANAFGPQVMHETHTNISGTRVR